MSSRLHFYIHCIGLLRKFNNFSFLERGECVPFRTDDAFLLRFLRARNFVVERAHRLVSSPFQKLTNQSIKSHPLQFVNYHEFKENNPEFFEGVELMHLKKLGDNQLITVPPYRDQFGRRMLLYRMGNFVYLMGHYRKSNRKSLDIF